LSIVRSDLDRPPRVHREVTSFVRRSARMRPSQRAAYEARAGHYLVEVPRGETSTSIAADAAPLDLVAVFGRDAPLVVEIGSGPGDSLVGMAAARPELNLLAFEVYEPAVAGLVARLHREGVGNVRVVVADAVAGLDRLLPDGALRELWTFFPDPWPKARHHKRRLVDATFVALAATRLAPGATWRLATDWDDYADQMRAVLDAEPRLTGGAVERWAERPVTKFERKGLEAGRRITDLAYTRL
jgi:tRNA (guanine-N7-)-methyltransferase